MPRLHLRHLLGILLGLGYTLALASPADPPDHAKACLEKALKGLLQGAQFGPPRPIESITELKIATFNVLNLFFHVGKHIRDETGSLVQAKSGAEKSLTDARELGEAVSRANPDILALQEVEGISSLVRFNKLFLGNNYIPLLLNGNDARGIQVGFLIKKDLPFQFQLISHQNETHLPAGAPTPVPVFARDLPVLMVRRAGAPVDSDPLLIVIGTHNRSRRPSPGDPDSSLKRKAEANRTAEIIQGYQQKYGPSVPVVLMGDFNSNVNSAPEYQVLWNSAHLEDVFNLETQKRPFWQRFTHTYHPNGSPRKPSQLDAILVSSALQDKVLDAQIYRYPDANGQEKPLPKTHDERKQNPSDHFLLHMTVDFQKLWKERQGGSAP